jgi:NTE family protein
MRQFEIAQADMAGRLTDEQGVASLNYPTNLTRVSEIDFDMIARHGSEVCEATMNAHSR